MAERIFGDGLAARRAGAVGPSAPTTQRPQQGVWRRGGPSSDFAAVLAAATHEAPGITVGGRAGELAFARALAVLARAQRTQALLPNNGGVAIRPVSQANPSEYDDAEQARIWGGSTCSAASLAAVLRARGVPVRIADVLRVMPGGLTPELGLVSRPSLMNAAAHFGLAAQEDIATYDALRAAAASGQPVLVSVRNPQFPEGHWLVVTSAHDRAVGVVDSSGYGLTSIPREDFLAAWSGKGIRLSVSSPTAAVANRPGVES